ncbi:hypothetical protein VCSRO193_3458 [Vibrio cholerae]|nr:hypothetical protein VCSRO193_3458 [Vibrio cholerae]
MKLLRIDTVEKFGTTSAVDLDKNGVIVSANSDKAALNLSGHIENDHRIVVTMKATTTHRR